MEFASFGVSLMARRKNSKNLTTAFRRGGTVVGLGSTEIWDGADLVLLRETIGNLFRRGGCRRFEVDMTHVQYVPSGFFGMLCDWYDRGVCVCVLSPTPRVRRMLWFTTCFRPIAEGCHEMSLEFSVADAEQEALFSQLDEMPGLAECVG